MDIDGKVYTVRDLMRPTVLIHEQATLKDALETLVDARSNIGCVVDGDGRMIGGVSTCDIIRAVLPEYLESDTIAAHFASDSMLKEDVRKAANLPISEIVDRSDATVGPDAHIIEATVISSKEGNDRIFVVDEERKPIGILTGTEIKQVLAGFLGLKNELPK